ncbi:hypothetical protein H5410_041504 [Solanum commersonii]|uniref:Uncharacterized protein n=1 Tax=Solanum commersonii TaxID=4109 RepID=A0A9J5XVQ1_SOLCO|nr:hypothetical protein H5410_041504 [Solanum commersonii]
MEEVPTKDGSYTMAEVKNLLLERRKLISSPTTINDLKQEINNFKKDIHWLKEKNITMEIRLDNIESLKESDSAADLNCIQEGLIPSMYFHKTTYSLRSANGEINSIEIDNILQNPKLQDKIATLKNKFSLDICGDHPNTFWNRKKHVVSFPYEEHFSEDNIPTKARPC